MKVLVLAPQPFFEVRGTPLAVLALVRALTRLGHRVDLLTFPQGEGVTVPGLRHLRSLPLPVGRVKAGASMGKLLLDLPFMAEAAWRMATGRYDVVHAVEEAAHLAAPLARLLQLPYVMDVDSSIPDQLRYSGFATRGPLLWLAERLDSHGLRHASAVVTVCTSLSEGVRRSAPDARVFQIEDPPLVDTKAPVSPDAVASLRSSLGLGPEPIVFYSGNFEPYQGVPLLLEAAAQLPGVQVVLMGGEPHEVESLRARTEPSHAGARCVFTGKQPPSELPLFLALADIVVSPRIRGENTPFKVYTYLASGKPLVATRLPTHTQLLDDSLAFLAEPTPEALAGAVRAALADREEAARRAARGVALIEREYSEARYVEKVRAAYAHVEGLVARSRRHPRLA
jgi:glycosyltransferase involved in cell wall biosynthesis